MVDQFMFWRKCGVISEDCEILWYSAQATGIQRAHVVARLRTGGSVICVATGALGMGMDATIRSVWRIGAPSTLGAYLNEAGRAGRDGKPAKCVLFNVARDTSSASEEMREYATVSALDMRKPRGAKVKHRFVCVKCSGMLC
jgi:superfamily II DNA helicase RecQ